MTDETSSQSADRTTAEQRAAFRAKWQHASGSERANYQLFIGELCRSARRATA